jgi:hypothetical protein
MQRAAFYLIERPPAPPEQECKEPDATVITDSNGLALAPLERWDYYEDITPAFCRAQSTLHRAYGGQCHYI